MLISANALCTQNCRIYRCYAFAFTAARIVWGAFIVFVTTIYLDLCFLDSILYLHPPAWILLRSSIRLVVYHDSRIPRIFIVFLSKVPSTHVSDAFRRSCRRLLLVFPCTLSFLCNILYCGCFLPIVVMPHSRFSILNDSSR